MVVDHVQDHREMRVVRALDEAAEVVRLAIAVIRREEVDAVVAPAIAAGKLGARRSEEHTSELQSLRHLVCRLLLEKKKTTNQKLAYPRNKSMFRRAATSAAGRSAD